MCGWELRPEAAGAAAGRPLVLRPGGRWCCGREAAGAEGKRTAAKRTPASRFATAAAVCRWELRTAAAVCGWELRPEAAGAAAGRPLES